MQYTVDYFIKKFEAIPNNFWVGNGGFITPSGSCAYGHCGVDGARSIEGLALTEVFRPLWKMPEGDSCIAHINDGRDRRYQQTTSKKRILAALYDIKNQGEKVERSVATEVQSELPQPEIKSTFKEITFTKIKEQIPSLSEN